MGHKEFIGKCNNEVQIKNPFVGCKAESLHAEKSC